MGRNETPEARAARHRRAVAEGKIKLKGPLTREQRSAIAKAGHVRRRSRLLELSLGGEAAIRQRVVDFTAELARKRKAARDSGERNPHAVRDREASIHAWFEGSRATALCTAVHAGPYALEVEVSISLHQPWECMSMRALERSMTRAVEGAMLVAGVKDDSRVPEAVERALSAKGF